MFCCCDGFGLVLVEVCGLLHVYCRSLVDFGLGGLGLFCGFAGLGVALVIGLLISWHFGFLCG